MNRSVNVTDLRPVLPDQVDVLIVGMGPVGATAANCWAATACARL